MSFVHASFTSKLCHSEFIRSLAMAAALFAVLALPTTSSRAERISHLGLNQKVLVLCVKFDDLATTRLATCQDWADLLNVEANRFFDAATDSLTSFDFQVANGAASDWYPIGVNSNVAFFPGTAQTLVIDRMNEAGVDFSGYNRMIIISNQPAFFGSAPSGFRDWKVDMGSEAQRVVGSKTESIRAMSVVTMHEWVQGIGTYDGGVLVAIHELGHNLGLLTHYGWTRTEGGALEDAVTPWSMMGRTGSIATHFFAFSKDERGWFGNGKKEVVDIGIGVQVSETLRVYPHSDLGALGADEAHLVEVPFSLPGSSAPFAGYMIESRIAQNEDEVVADGVLISLVDERPSNYPVPYWVKRDPDAPQNASEAALEVGDRIEDAQSGIAIEVTADYGDSWDVRIDRVPYLYRTDPWIMPWAGPPWETEDIWVDSPKNGWGTYTYTDAAGNPEGNGDRPWLNNDNRIWFRVRNGAPVRATNVRVRVEAGVPRADSSELDWKLVHWAQIPEIEASSSAVSYVQWNPKENAHTCLRVVIQDIPAELSTDNNEAQENIFDFETSQNSPWKQVSETIRVNNASEDESLDVWMQVDDVPDQWLYSATPAQFSVAPGGKQDVSVVIYPGGDPNGSPSEGYVAGYVGRPSVTAWVPWEDTMVALAGGEFRTRLVNETTLGVSTPATASAGSSVAVTGQLVPPVEGATIAVKVDGPATQKLVYYTTDSEGGFNGSLSFDRGGSWEVAAFYDGTGEWGSSESTAAGIEIAGSLCEVTADLPFTDADADGDDVGDACDNCPDFANSNQQNSDDDSLGDACDTDDDNDGLADTLETATGEMTGPNSLGTSPLQVDTDGDGFEDSVEVAAGSDPNDWDETPEDLATNVPSMTFLGLGILQGALVFFGLRFGLYHQRTRKNEN